MKIPCLLFAFLGIFRLSAQCPTTYLQFTDQSSIDSFSILYPGCKNIPGDVKISGSDITHLDGLSNVESIGGYLSIFFCESLYSLHGLEQLHSVKELSIIGNHRLSGLEPLDSLQITQSIFINSNKRLKRLNGLENVQQLVDYLVVIANDSLESLSGLKRLRSVGKTVTIERNNLLTDLKGLDSLTTIGNGIFLVLNPSITQLTGLDHSFNIGYEFQILGNNQLASLGALKQMSGLKALHISANASLETLEGLEHITQLPGGLKIVDNLKLHSLGALSRLRTVSILNIFSNNSLTSLNGLDSLNSVQNLSIEQTQLSDFTGLGRLKSISNQFLVQNNPLLTSFNGLDQLTFIIMQATVLNNPSLSGCAIEAICKKFNNTPSLVYFDNNGPGCDSNPEVYNACFPVSVRAEPEAGGPIVFPNPSTGRVQFRYQDGVALSIQVMNAWGQLVLTQRESAEQSIDLSGQAPGLYWVIFQDRGKQWRQPLLISCGQ